MENPCTSAHNCEQIACLGVSDFTIQYNEVAALADWANDIGANLVRTFIERNDFVVPGEGPGDKSFMPTSTMMKALFGVFLQ
jgi:hypothetical protein